MRPQAWSSVRLRLTAVRRPHANPQGQAQELVARLPVQLAALHQHLARAGVASGSPMQYCDSCWGRTGLPCTRAGYSMERWQSTQRPAAAKVSATVPQHCARPCRFLGTLPPVHCTARTQLPASIPPLPPAAPDCTFAVVWTGPADGPPRLNCPKCGVQQCILCHATPFHEDQSCEEAKAAAAAAKAAAQAAKQAAAASSAAAAAAARGAAADEAEGDAYEEGEQKEEEEEEEEESYETFIERQIAAGNMRRCDRCTSEFTSALHTHSPPLLRLKFASVSATVPSCHAVMLHILLPPPAVLAAAPIEKSDGCFKMMCNCGYRFCFKCGSENAQCNCTREFYPESHHSANPTSSLKRKHRLLRCRVQVAVSTSSGSCSCAFSFSFSLRPPRSWRRPCLLLNRCCSEGTRLYEQHHRRVKHGQLMALVVICCTCYPCDDAVRRDTTLHDMLQCRDTR